MQIIDTIKDFDIARVGERVEEFGSTAVENYSETSDRVIDAVVDTNKRIVDTVVSNVERFPEAPFAERVPSAAEAGKTYLDAVERVADFNRDMNRRIVEMLPVTSAAT